MKILGTGLSGLVGSRIVELNPEHQFTDLSLDTGYDILKLDSLESAFKSFLGDTIIHLAAFTDTGSAWEQRGNKNGLCYQLNVIGTQNIVNLCQKYNKYLIHISTDFVFDGTKKTKYTEEDLPHPIDWYGQTKYLAEKSILSSNLPASIVRIAYPYRSKFDSKLDIVRKIKSKIELGENLNLFDDQTITPTFIDDIAFAIKYFVEKKSKGIYHLVGSSFESPYKMAITIANLFNLDNSKITATKLSEYLKNENNRPFAQNINMSNDKITALGLKMNTFLEGLTEIKRQIEL